MRSVEHLKFCQTFVWLSRRRKFKAFIDNIYDARIPKAQVLRDTNVMLCDRRSCDTCDETQAN